MDIQQIKSYFKKQDESENLAKKVRDSIKQTSWQKQDSREGFTETFTPLIESQDSIKKSIDEQQNATLEQLRANQLAITDKENKLDELLTTMLALTGDAGPGPSSAPAAGPSSAPGPSSAAAPGPSSAAAPGPSSAPGPDYFDQYLNNKEAKDILNDFNITNLPSSYYNSKKEKIYNKVLNLKKLIDNFKEDNNLTNIAKFSLTKDGIANAEAKSKNPHTRTKKLIKEYNILSLYFYQMSLLSKYKREFTGKGMFFYNNQLQLLDRLELLGASIIAGNNGVIPEFSEIAHQLAKMSVISKKQLNTLLKNYVLNR